MQGSKSTNVIKHSLQFLIITQAWMFSNLKYHQEKQLN